VSKRENEDRKKKERRKMKKSRRERESKKERMMSRKSGREGRMERENKQARREIEKECVCVFMSERKETSETYLLNRYMNLKQNYVLIKISDLLT